MAQADEALVFAIENNTSTPLLEFYATPVTDETWGDDLLGDSTVPPASSQRITLDNPPDDCLYDVIGIFGEGEDDYVEEYAVDLCDLQGGTYAFFDEEDHVFRVENQTETPISGFYFTPATEESWGGNLFEASGYVLQPGDFVDVPVDASECEYDFRAVFADDSVDEESVNVCDGTPGVTFVED